MSAALIKSCDIPQDRYRVFLQDVADAFFETNIQGDFVFFNDALCRIFGYARDEIEHRNFRRFMDSANADYAFKSFNSMFENRKRRQQHPVGDFAKRWRHPNPRNQRQPP